uniref:UPF0029 domain-containing protein n=1 Tax=Panagrellus redivivus TaxID=6233 RepID=A0A7E4VEM3_PANRE
MALTQEASDELLVMTSMYFESATQDSEHSIIVKLAPFEVRFCLDSESRPLIEISAPGVPGSSKASLKRTLDFVASQKPGDICLPECIEAAQEFIDVFNSSWQPSHSAESDSEEVPQRQPEIPAVPVPEIYGTDTLLDRKSVFQAHIARIDSKEQAMAVLDTLMSNTKIARATHRIYAYRTFVTKDGRNLALHDCEDDGEHGAGAKLLQLLENMDVRDVMVVVTRWYGGIHLGPDRFKHILNKARQVILESGLHTPK